MDYSRPEPFSFPPPIPRFEVRLVPPDLSPWRDGNTGIPGFTTFDSGQPGPHLALTALTHGNEIAGAIVLDRLLRLGIEPARGKITFGFVNLAAFDRFDAGNPTASRFVEEDMNRLWAEDVIASSRRSCELNRAREILPLIESVDVLLDLHSMLWPSDPLLLSGSSPKGRRLAFGIGVPGMIVADMGHASGRRLIDYARFTDPDTTAAAVLVEAGQHWDQPTVDMTQACIGGVLYHVGVVQPGPGVPQRPSATKVRFAEVTSVVTAITGSFAFLQPYRGGDIIRNADTLIATDGTAEIRTPYDDCLLVMPSLRPSRGHTAVRLARFVD